MRHLSKERTQEKMIVIQSDGKSEGGEVAMNMQPWWRQYLIYEEINSLTEQTRSAGIGIDAGILAE